ncbi:MAG TPA: hypothetical protein VK700_10065 [Steroidobacteraceae bacterium]|jgi:hypothetical protein|nr:hypothetical protein [Steroidobacteraceae bacterium]
MRLSVSQEQRPEGTRRSLRLTETADGRPIDIYFDFPGETFPEPHVLDGFVNAIIFHAMGSNQDLHVDGLMTRSAWLNLATFQEAWCRWKPDVYKPIKIEPRSLTDEPPGGKAQSIAAFSGGADAIFTVLRHADDQFALNSVMLVHGFDVPTDRADLFGKLLQRQQPLLQRLNMRPRIVRTNIAELRIQNWHDSFLAQLSCCLHNYSHEFRFGLTAGGEPYDALVLPWGQNPCTDYLLSGDGFSIVHDGAAFSRTEKIALIAKDPVATQAVKVCWEAADLSTNCGICEKCIRTRLNFKAVGVDRPSCFDGELTLEQIRRIGFGNDSQRAAFRSILDYADSQGLSGDWLDAVRMCLRYDQMGVMGRAVTHLAHGEFSLLSQKIRRKLSSPAKA